MFWSCRTLATLAIWAEQGSKHERTPYSDEAFKLFGWIEVGWRCEGLLLNDDARTVGATTRLSHS